ncbi:hypothetical protein B6N60_01781 [Richelia sinica FACHB-800]|uniref:Uncharacterized protein n=1 Tax=Richelia sinica FACHB-800 TaxID=1357546 RepID=A0A975T6L7_9NOST|nr:hypothetical protein B6N60_01781 [Richelia sinica FACHB-800]
MRHGLANGQHSFTILSVWVSRGWGEWSEVGKLGYIFIFD